MDVRVPSIDFIFRITPGGSNIRILRFAHSVWFVTGERFIIGSGTETPQYGSGQVGWQSVDANITSTVELGHEKAAIIDRFVSRLSRDNDIVIQIAVSCDYVEQIKFLEGSDQVRFQNANQLLVHSIPRNHWDRWITQWGKLQRVIVVSGTVARKLDDLKQLTGNLGYEELVGLLLDNYAPSKTPLETTFISTLPTKKEIRSKLEEILGKAGDAGEVSLTGWIDGSIITHLQDLVGKGVTVRLLTRSATEKGVTSAIQQLQRVGAEVRKNDMVHARIVIVGEREIMVSSADPKASSLVDNREAGIYSTNPAVVRATRSFFEEVWNENEPHETPSGPRLARPVKPVPMAPP